MVYNKMKVITSRQIPTYNGYVMLKLLEDNSYTKPNYWIVADMDESKKSWTEYYSYVKLYKNKLSAIKKFRNININNMDYIYLSKTYKAKRK